jgi:diacylglycerol kinase family enzyme
MIAGARGRLKKILGVSSYIVSVTRAAMMPRRFTVRAEVDGGVIEREGVVAMVLNLGCIFHGMLELAPGSSLTDGLLDLVIVDAPSLGDALAFSVFEMLLRRRRADPRWTFARGREISIEAHDASVPCQVDGDLVDDRHLSLVVAPGECGLLAPLGSHIL